MVFGTQGYSVLALNCHSPMSCPSGQLLGGTGSRVGFWRRLDNELLHRGIQRAKIEAFVNYDLERTHHDGLLESIGHARQELPTRRKLDLFLHWLPSCRFGGVINSIAPAPRAWAIVGADVPDPLGIGERTDPNKSNAPEIDRNDSDFFCSLDAICFSAERRLPSFASTNDFSKADQGTAKTSISVLSIQPFRPNSGQH